MRLKCRYIIGVIESNAPKPAHSLTYGDILKDVRSQFESNFGLIAFGHETTIFQLEYDEETGLFMLRCGSMWCDEVRTTLSYMKTIRNVDVTIHLLETVSTEKRGQAAYQSQLARLKASKK